MGLWAEKYGNKMVLKPKVVISKKRSFEEIVTDTLDEQEKIAKGEEIRSQKKNTKGEYPLKKSWYNKETGLINMKIGISPIFDKSLPCQNNKEFLEFIDVIRNHWDTDEDLKVAFKECEIKLEKQIRKRSKTMTSS